MDKNSIEILGYVASALIAISITMGSIVRLRVINCIGGILLGIYGVYIDSIPVAGLNFFIGVANIYYLWKIFKARKELRKASENVDKTE